MAVRVDHLVVGSKEITMPKAAGSAKAANASKDRSLRVKGTSPLSFDVTPGDILSIREFEPSTHTRPTLSGGFKTSAFLIFNGITKVGSLNAKDVARLGDESIPDACTVTEVNRATKVLKVELRQPPVSISRSKLRV